MYCKDWLRLQLTGEVCTDVTDASASFMAMATRAYEPRLLELLGLGDALTALTTALRSMTESPGQ